jgi:hypothetical protein
MIYWGEKPWRDTIGVVADRCFICWANRLHDVERVNFAGHLFLLFRVGQGRAAGHEVTCRVCGLRRRADLADFASIAEGPIELEEAVARTNPSLPARALPDPRTLGAKERSEALQGTMRLVEADLQRHVQERHWSPLGRAVGWLGLILGLVIVSFMVMDDLFDLDPPTGPILVLSPVFLVCILATLYFVFTVIRWYVRQEIEPRLARAFAALRVTPEEFDELFAEARGEGLLLARRVRPRRVRKLMRRYET